MAQPARVVRVRRASSRRRPVSGKHPDQLPHKSVFPRTERVWNTWFVLLVSALSRRSAATSQAVRSARTALTGTAAPFDLPRTPAARPIARLASYRYNRFPLRLAAHLVTLCVVLVVVLSAHRSFGLAAAQEARTLEARSPATPLADVQVQRNIFTLPADQNNQSNLDALPDVRAPNPDLLPAFAETHLVAEGETVGQIASAYHISVAALFWANDLGAESVFAAGQELRIPRLSGLPHIIEEGETLDSIAARFGVRPQAITLFKANEIDPNQPLPVGRELFIPGGVAAYPEAIVSRFGGEAGIASMQAVAAGTVREAETNLRSGPGRSYPKLGVLDAGRRLKLLARHEQWVKVEDGAGQSGWVRSDLLGISDATLVTIAETNDFAPPPPIWVWPTQGRITSPFGWRSAPFRSFHDGLDIANAAWTKIYAARSGQVFEAGWCSGFGYCVKIDHGDGISTIYGHLIKKPPVKVGDSVDAGDLIGYMGSTYDRSGGGYSTGVHLHFTVKINGKAVNPNKFLP